MKDPAPYRPIVDHYEACYRRFGREARGVDWPNQSDLERRFNVMLGVAEAEQGLVEIIDLGCGPGLLLDYIESTGRRAQFNYTGIDVSPLLVESAKTAWPAEKFFVRDILTQPLPEQSCDYVIMNGVMTEKQSLNQEAMVDFAKSLLAAAYRSARKGIAFNVMSVHVDWKRDDLFHWAFDEVAAFAKQSLSRHMVFRADYGLYEFTCYVFREARS